METQNKELINRAIQVLNKGGIVIYPTDTAFGIGCRMDDEKAVDKLFTIRRRPLTQATPVLVSSRKQALTYYLSPSQIVRHLMKEYWPGALTIIAPCKKESVYSPIRGDGINIGLRMPHHKIALALIRGVGVPILGPSANFHGNLTPYRYDDLDPELVRLVDYVVPGECSVSSASTVVDCSVRPYKIMRQGSIVLHGVVLIIDSSGSEVIRVAVKTGDRKQHALEKPLSKAKAQEVLPMIEELFKEQELTLDDITAITVSVGPGSYTGLRVGIAIANMLSVLLGVPINGLPIGEPVVPLYESDRYPL